MQLTRNGIETAAGPTQWFTGTVLVDEVARPTGTTRLSVSSVHFTPAARTHWHTHPNGQTIFVTEGICLARRAAARSRCCGPATARSSSPARTTGTAPRPAGS